MSSFTLPLYVEPINDTDWRLLDDFTYYLGELYSNEYVRVPKGYVTDFASVPRIFWSIIPPWGHYGKAAVVHDYLCTHRTLTRYERNGEVTIEITRKQADKIFLEAMEVLKVPVWKRYAMYYAVRLYATVRGIK